jgi:biopolymer transport protein ExbB
LIGPAGVFLADDGRTGASHPDPRANSLEPSMLSFINPADAEAAQALVQDGAGTFPLDPTLLNARKIEETEETFLEHVQKGGPVMYPIAGMFVAAMLVSILKYLSMLFTPGASKRRIKRLGAAILADDSETALAEARRIGGPTGRMLADGIEHMDHPKELVEEIMYESVLETKLKLQRLLPLVAIIAAAAPLMGLLGTVTGIINTFKMITVFGTGDPKTLSGGISEALITTKFGLVVAIPSLIIHAFLSRTAKGKIDGMEQAAISFTNVLAILQGKPAEEAADPEPEEMTPTSAAAEETTPEDSED